MTRFKYYSNYLACLLGTLIAFELCWIGAKYVIEGEVVHTCLDHFIAVCGSFYITRDTMKIWLKVQKEERRTSMNNKVMAEKLRKLRGNRSRQEVAEACGISVSALAMYEAGERVPRDEIKIKLAKFYNRSVSYIFFTN